MAAVSEGGDRQQLHEKIREHAFETVKNMREKGKPNDLLQRLRGDKAFEKSCTKTFGKNGSPNV
jgi:adenylosuccinate lyase